MLVANVLSGDLGEGSIDSACYDQYTQVKWALGKVGAIERSLFIEVEEAPNLCANPDLRTGHVQMQ